MSDPVAPSPCPTCGRSAAPSPLPGWLHPTLLLGIIAGIVYVGFQLADEWSKIQDFSIYSTPPGKAELLKLGITFIVIVAASAGLNVKDAITTGLASLGLTKGN